MGLAYAWDRSTLLKNLTLFPLPHLATGEGAVLAPSGGDAGGLSFLIVYVDERGLVLRQVLQP